MSAVNLADLNPRWQGLNTAAKIAASIRIGMTFDCPCCVGTERAIKLGVRFRNAIDPDNLLADTGWRAAEPAWDRQGETFDTLSLVPSVDASNQGHWHGTISSGKATSS
jgi:hypothetical protein